MLTKQVEYNRFWVPEHACKLCRLSSNFGTVSLLFPYPPLFVHRTRDVFILLCVTKHVLQSTRYTMGCKMGISTHFQNFTAVEQNPQKQHYNCYKFNRQHCNRYECCYIYRCWMILLPQWCRKMIKDSRNYCYKRCLRWELDAWNQIHCLANELQKESEESLYFTLRDSHFRIICNKSAIIWQKLGCQVLSLAFLKNWHTGFISIFEKKRFSLDNNENFEVFSFSKMDIYISSFAIYAELHPCGGKGIYLYTGQP